MNVERGFASRFLMLHFAFKLLMEFGLLGGGLKTRAPH